MPKRVALFISCLADEFLPRVGVAITKILERNDCVVAFPAGQTCCGQPMYNDGYHAEAGAVARRFIELFESFDYVVTPSASCAATVRTSYPRLLATDGASAGRATALAGKTFEFVEFLTRVVKVELKGVTLPVPQTVAYHPACYQRALGGRDETPAVLKKLGNVANVPLEKSDQCCGFGGTFSLRFPGISAALADDKARAIAAAGATTTVCNEPGCALTLAGVCYRAGVRSEVKHVSEVMAEALGIEIDGF